VTVTAKVVKVDQKGRVVTLRTPPARSSTSRWATRLKNLPQVKKGDDVIATYY